MPNLKKAIDEVEDYVMFLADGIPAPENVLACLKAYERDKKRLDWILLNCQITYIKKGCIIEDNIWYRREIDSAMKESKK